MRGVWLKRTTIATALAILTTGCVATKITVFGYKGEFYVIDDQRDNSYLYQLRNGVWFAPFHDPDPLLLEEVAANGTAVGSVDKELVYRDLGLSEAERTREEAKRAGTRPPLLSPEAGSVRRNEYMEAIDPNRTGGGF